MRCTPTTVSVSAATRIFMKPRPSLPESVFFMGLRQQLPPQYLWHITRQPLRPARAGAESP